MKAVITAVICFVAVIFVASPEFNGSTTMFGA